MKATTPLRVAAGTVAGAAAAALVGYAACAGTAWARFGHAGRARTVDEEDGLLDGFMPLYDVVERHHVHVAATAEITLGVARDMNVFDSTIVRAIFKGRELMLGATPPPEGVALPPGLVPAALRLGWGVLGDQAGREIVLGAVTKPWEPNPVFRDLPPREFAAFAEPDYVKIVWTLRADPLRADPLPDGTCVFRTETRALATDVSARAKFRRYWALVSPGVALIRRMMLEPVKGEAERRAKAVAAGPPVVVAV
jgi:hypothetical protein